MEKIEISSKINKYTQQIVDKKNCNLKHRKHRDRERGWGRGRERKTSYVCVCETFKRNEQTKTKINRTENILIEWVKRKQRLGMLGQRIVSACRIVSYATHSTTNGIRCMGDLIFANQFEAGSVYFCDSRFAVRVFFVCLLWHYAYDVMKYSIR